MTQDNRPIVTIYAERMERIAIDIISILAPWLAPIPSAYRVQFAVVHYLDWNPIIGWIAALAVESVGVVSVINSLDLYEWNQTKNKTDPAAPFLLSVGVVAFYFLVTIGLTVLLDINEALRVYSPALFPLLAATGAVNIAIKRGQKRREERKLSGKRRGKKPPRPRKDTPESSGNLPESKPRQTAVNGQVKDWRTFRNSAPQEEILRIAGMSPSEIRETYRLNSLRTARNWKGNAETYAETYRERSLN